MIFTGEISEISAGAGIICKNENINAAVNVKCGAPQLCVTGKDGKYEIEYSAKSEFFRGLAILIYNIKNGETDFCIKQKRQFDSCGIMIDVSRNAVLKVDTVKTVIETLAKMGLNMIMLYTEDTFKMDKYPYFGYMRGAYTKDEIKEIVAYGELFGVELVPCIQTLAHLARTMHWSYAKDMSDTRDILLIDEDKTYEFIEEMIKTARECYHTDKIHIGMDEAHDVGLGEYLRRHGYVDRFKLLSRHLNRVMEITDKYNFKPMMWSDMFFRLASKTGDYYDLEAKMPENVPELIPENLSMVYWDYYNNDEKTCDFMIKTHKDMKHGVVFAGGIWVWSGLTPNYDKTFITTKAGLSACRKNGIKNVFATMWGDDGAECSIFEALLGMQLYGEYNYFEEVETDRLKKMFKVCTGYDMDAFALFDVDNYGEKCSNHDATVSKQVFYNDILTGLFDKNLSLLDLKAHYGEILKKLETAAPQKGYEYLFDYHKQYVKVLYEKCKMGEDVTAAYLSGDKAKLKQLAEEIKNLYDDVKIMHGMVTDIWFKNNKPFGYEYFDSKIGGVESRIKCAYMRITDYLDGKIDSIGELTEPRLWYTGKETPFVHQYFTGNIART